MDGMRYDGLGYCRMGWDTTYGNGKYLDGIGWNMKYDGIVYEGMLVQYVRLDGMKWGWIQ